MLDQEKMLSLNKASGLDTPQDKLEPLQKFMKNGSSDQGFISQLADNPLFTGVKAYYTRISQNEHADISRVLQLEVS